MNDRDKELLMISAQVFLYGAALALFLMAVRS